MSAVTHVPAPDGTRIRSGMSPPDSVTSWHQVFEREQMAALRAFRSVPASAGMPPGVAAAAAAPAGKGTGGAAPFDRPSSMRANAMDFNAPRTLAVLRVPAVPPGPNGIRSAACLQASGAAIRNAGSGKTAATADARAAAVCTAPATKWPARKAHCVIRPDGAHLWLRDAATAPDDALLQQWLSEMQHMLAAGGTPLASFTLNGKPCLVPIAVR